MSSYKYSVTLHQSFWICIVCIVSLSVFSGCRSAVPWLDEDISVIEDDLPEVKREFRAVWIATVANIDWPSQPGLTAEQQQRELIRIFDRVTALNMNSVIFQVRPAADAVYHSPYEPWSSYLSGTMGEPPLPEYDPLEFAVREAHKRGLEFHAWFNPFRAGHPVDASPVSADHISRTNPELVHPYGDFLWLDPGNPEAREHSRKVILDVLERYDIDGIHFDDYFYPYRSYANGADFPDEESWQRAAEEGVTMSRGDWRRNNVDRFIEQIYHDIRERKPHVKFGISPFGIWQSGYPRRTTGFNAHEELYADSRHWLQNGWVDYFTPQIYYRVDQIAQPYPVMLQWWVEQNHHHRHIWPGLYTSRIITTDTTWPGDEISRQLYVSRGFPGVTGAVHFSMQAFMRNPGRFRDLIAAGPYAEPALVPSTPWMAKSVPGSPEIRVDEFPDKLTVQIEPKDSDIIRSWVIRTRTEGQWNIDILPGDIREYSLYNPDSVSKPDMITVAAVDRLGTKGFAARLVISENRFPHKIPYRPDNVEFISRGDWSAAPAGGYPAHGLRKNLAPGDTLRFNDLAIILDNIKPVPVLTQPSDQFYTLNLMDDRILPDSSGITLFRNGVSEEFLIAEGESFNWYGFHISVTDITPRLPGTNHGNINLEVSTLLSLPVNRGAIMSAGLSHERIRVTHRIRKITLHHTGSAEPLSADEDASEKVRTLQQWSMEQRNWWDLPYHFLVDLNGNVYEGRDIRYASDINGNYDPRGHLQIAAIGNYNLQKPTEKQLTAIAEIIGWASEKYNIPSDEIYGHDDWANTSGPGRHIRSLLDDGSLIHMVNDIMQKNTCHLW